MKPAERFCQSLSGETPLNEPDAATHPEDTPPGILELHEELIAATSEARRSNRRTLEILKNFGSVLETISGTALDTHKAVRALQSGSQSPGGPGGLSDEWRLALIDLADRIARLQSGYQRKPAAADSWWPPTRRAAAAWQDAWEMQEAGLSILSGHVDTLLKRADLVRIQALGKAFDPQTMTAVEAVPDASRPDHSVIEELLPGWCCISNSRVIRPAQVKVSRNSTPS
jgi:hypothetical protein